MTARRTPPERLFRGRSTAGSGDPPPSPENTIVVKRDFEAPRRASQRAGLFPGEDVLERVGKTHFGVAWKRAARSSAASARTASVRSAATRAAAVARRAA